LGDDFLLPSAAEGAPKECPAGTLVAASDMVGKCMYVCLAWPFICGAPSFVFIYFRSVNPSR
jgi:hypothetical protein